MRRVFISVCLMLTIVFAGCGKKSRKIEKKVATVAESIIEKKDDFTKLASRQQQQDIPIYQYEEDKYFDEDEISDFAFIDDEEEKSTDVKTLETGKLEKDILASRDEEEAFSYDDWDEDDDMPLAWEADDESSDLFKVVKFDLNKNIIRNDQKTVVKENVESAKAAVDTGKNIVISGHACQLGSASFNLSLSERRAKVVKDEMMKRGVPENKIRVLGCGNEMPVISSDAKDRATKVRELAPNRRAEVTLN